MSMHERERLTARVRQLRRVFTDADERGRAATSGPGRIELCALEVRIAHLEQLVEGLQDSVHRPDPTVVAISIKPVSSSGVRRTPCFEFDP
jgi:hypothetical protein